MRKTRCPGAQRENLPRDNGTGIAPAPEAPHRPPGSLLRQHGLPLLPGPAARPSDMWCRCRKPGPAQSAHLPTNRKRGLPHRARYICISGAMHNIPRRQAPDRAKTGTSARTFSTLPISFQIHISPASGPGRGQWGPRPGGPWPPAPPPSPPAGAVPGPLPSACRR